MNKELRKAALDALFREGDDISQRTDWSLIFHAIMFEAFFAADFRMPVGLLASVCACFWLIVGISQNWRFAQLHESLVRHPDGTDPLYVFTRSLNESRRNVWLVRATPIFTILIPGSALLTWVCLVIASILCGKISTAGWWALPMALVGASLAAFLVGRSPRTAIESSAALLDSPNEGA